MLELGIAGAGPPHLPAAVARGAFVNRMEMRRAAIGVEGLGASHERAEYLDLLGPDETPAVHEAMGGMSSCALTVRGLWRQLGVVHHRLQDDYVNQMAVQDVIEIAKEAAAWHELHPGQVWEPQRGDVLHLFAPEHVATVVEVESDGAGGWLWKGVEGGQGLHGASIARVEHHLRGTTDTRLDSGHARQVTGYVDCDQVGQVFGYIPHDTDAAPPT